MTSTKGLEGVVATQSAISSIIDDTLTYVGYDIDDLADNASFEEVIYLLWHQRLPKEDELAATMMGIKTTRYKVLAFVISAFITGVAGAFYASMIGFIEPNSFTFDTSTLIISIVILGGMGTIRGMFLGSAILIAFPEASRFLMDYRFVVYGIVLVVMMRFRPQGALGWKSQLPYKFPKLAKQELEKRKKDSLVTEQA